jgi:hypothetical protein
MTMFTPDAELTAEQRAHSNEIRIRQQGALITELSNGLSEVLALLRANHNPEPPVTNSTPPVTVQVEPMPPKGGPKLTLPPEFCGRTDKLGFVFWSFKLTKYLANFPTLSEPKRIAFSSNLLTGQALTWFMHREKHGAPFSSLEDFLDG